MNRGAVPCYFREIDMKKKKRKLFDELIEKHRREAVEPACVHFPKCGGCMFLDMAYGDQLELKKDYLNGLFSGIFQFEHIEGSEPLGYRTRMDYVCAFGKMGLRERGSYRFVVDIESCPLLPERARVFYETTRPDILEVEGYNYLKHEGYLRYLVIRQAGFTGELMANLVVAAGDNRVEYLLEKMVSSADSVSLLLSDGLADLSFGKEILTVKRGYIEEEFDGIRFKITPNAFFQSNSGVALNVYRKIKSLTRGRVLDLYSGVGSISLYVSQAADLVTGVEMVEEAVVSARENCEINSVANADFICADSLHYMKDFDGRLDTLVLDPPRSGMHPDMIKHINRVRPERIIYMSCNPAVFRNELPLFEGYKIRSIEAFDMFPQTPHVETLSFLERG